MRARGARLLARHAVRKGSHVMGDCCSDPGRRHHRAPRCMKQPPDVILPARRNFRRTVGSDDSSARSYTLNSHLITRFSVASDKRQGG